MKRVAELHLLRLTNQVELIQIVCSSSSMKRSRALSFEFKDCIFFVYLKIYIGIFHDQIVQFV